MPTALLTRSIAYQTNDTKKKEVEDCTDKRISRIRSIHSSGSKRGALTYRRPATDDPSHERLPASSARSSCSANIIYVHRNNDDNGPDREPFSILLSSCFAWRQSIIHSSTNDCLTLNVSSECFTHGGCNVCKTNVSILHHSIGRHSVAPQSSTRYCCRLTTATATTINATLPLTMFNTRQSCIAADRQNEMQMNKCKRDGAYVHSR